MTNERKSGSAADDNLLVGALMDLVGFLNSPQRDDLLLREAGVSLDRALFPLLVRIGAQGPLGVAELAAMVGTRSGARAAVQEDDRLRPLGAAAFPIEPMAVADVEETGLIRLDRRIEGAALGHRLLRLRVGKKA